MPARNKTFPVSPIPYRPINHLKTSSPFYQKIDSNAIVDPNSAVMVAGLVDQANQAFLVAIKEWTAPVYYVDASTPKWDVKLTAGWSPKKHLLNVPIPEFAEPGSRG